MKIATAGWRICVAATLLAISLTWLPSFVTAQAVRDASPLEFHDDAEARRFNALVAELRCVMCQNQSLADSNAQIAHDLRREVFDLMRGGKSDAEIKSFLVERYGEFVLYKPPLAKGTWLLWFGPALLLALGAIVVIRIVRRRSRGVVADDPGQEW